MKANLKSLGVMLGAGFLATVAMLPQARGELVYDNEAQQAAKPAPRIDDRENLREVIGSSQKAQATVQAAQPVTQIVVQPAPAAQPAMQAAPMAQPMLQMTAQVAPQQAAPELENMSKAELMRRERMRAEMKNEDILQERLEELRLRDERRRTDQLISGAPAPTGMAPTGGMVMKDEVVASPITDHPGVASPTGAQMAVAATGASGQQDQIGTSRSSAVASLDGEEKTRLAIVPRFGISNMNGNQQFNIQSRFTGGVGMSVGVSENVDFQVGYSYSEYGVAMSSTNPWVVQAQVYTGTYTPNFETLAMKQNLVDAGLKMHVLGPDAKLRPFVGGGAAYSKSFINYDARIINAYNQTGTGMSQPWAQDYETSSFLGYLTTGLDVRLSKSVTVGADFRYYTVLSARENQNVNNAAFNGYSNGLYGGAYGYNPYGLSSYGASDPEKQALGGSLARSSFYSILGTVTFSF